MRYVTFVNDPGGKRISQAAELAVLRAATAAIVARRDWRAVLADVLGVCVDVVPLRSALIAAEVGPGREITVVAAVGRIGELPPGLFAQMRSVLDEGSEFAAVPITDELALRALNSASGCIAPLRAGGKQLGVLVFATAAHTHAQWITLALATQIAEALALAQTLGRLTARRTTADQALTELQAALLWMEGAAVVEYSGDLRALVGDFVGAIDLETLFLSREGGRAVGRTGRRLALRRLPGTGAILVRGAPDTAPLIRRALATLEAMVPGLRSGPITSVSADWIAERLGHAPVGTGHVLGAERALAVASSTTPGPVNVVLSDSEMVISGNGVIPAQARAIWVAHGALLAAQEPPTWTVRLPLH